MYGGPVLEWWRPGGSVLAITRQGSQANLSLPPSRVGVATLKQSDTAHCKAKDPARENDDGLGIGKAEERSTSP